MDPRRDPSPEHPDVLTRIGPGQDPTLPATELMDRARREARCEDEEARAAAALMRRLLVALALVLVIGAVCFVVLPLYGMKLPIIMPILAFIAIFLGAILTAPSPKPRPRPSDDGRPIGCCPGPRPLRSFRDD
ncbi:MAG: hypothetical protein ACF8Q5_14935 [Phycisphaerales bacterium JB040]